MTERFEAKFKRNCGPRGECWDWVGSINSRGYGQFRIGQKWHKAHRIAYELYNGPIPNGTGFHGTVVRHSCDNKRCVNPLHLLTGTHADNMRDMAERDRNARARKLTRQDVISIRAKYETNSYTQGQLAEMYGVQQSLVHLIVRNKIWKSATA